MCQEKGGGGLKRKKGLFEVQGINFGDKFDTLQRCPHPLMGFDSIVQKYIQQKKTLYCNVCHWLSVCLHLQNLLLRDNLGIFVSIVLTCSQCERLKYIKQLILVDNAHIIKA